MKSVELLYKHQEKEACPECVANPAGGIQHDHASCGTWDKDGRPISKKKAYKLLAKMLIRYCA